MNKRNRLVSVVTENMPNSFLFSSWHRSHGETKHQLHDNTGQPAPLDSSVYPHLEVNDHSFYDSNINLAREDRWYERPKAEPLFHTQTGQRPFTPGCKHTALSWDIWPKRLTWWATPWSGVCGPLTRRRPFTTDPDESNSLVTASQPVDPNGTQILPPN